MRSMLTFGQLIRNWHLNMCIHTTCESRNKISLAQADTFGHTNTKKRTKNSKTRQKHQPPVECCQPTSSQTICRQLCIPEDRSQASTLAIREEDKRRLESRRREASSSSSP